MTVKILITALTLSVCSFMVSCEKKVEPTTVEVVDRIRHYYPVVQGEKVNLDYELTNTGKKPLVIKDIQPSCGCIVEGETEKMILPGKSVKLKFIYNSIKNIGYVQHVVRIFGNIQPKGVLELIFDVNIVPNSDYTRDYEENYARELEKEGIKNSVDGNTSERGYYVDIEKDSRSHEKYPWRKEE